MVLINIFVFWWFFDYPVFAENQRLIFDEKKDNQKNMKKQKYDQKFWKIIQKTTNMIKIMTKCYKNTKFTKRENSRLTKNIFSCLLNWILGHLQSSDDANKIAIREISIRAIQKLSDLDQQTIAGGPNFNLTNGKISFIFHYFFCSFHFYKNLMILLQFWLISQLFWPKLRFFCIFYWFKSVIGVPFLLSPFGGFR